MARALLGGHLARLLDARHVGLQGHQAGRGDAAGHDQAAYGADRDLQDAPRAEALSV